MARPRLATQTKIERGTLQPSRTNPHEPQAQPGRPAMPTDFSPAEQVVWEQVCTLLEEENRLTRSDALALENFSRAFAELRTLEQQIKATGHTQTTTGRHGEMIRINPLVTARDRADERVRAWITKLGLTASDRSRVSAVTRDTPDSSLDADFA